MIDNLYLSDYPINSTDLISQDDTCSLEACGQHNFKRITLLLIGDRANDSQAHFTVVGFWGEHKSWSVLSLFVPGSW